ncbi:hypothetical protein ACIO3O_18965 [Streptomyces sp. NPDC087440]|uniref:hypothetical protein n=1 Tax=Streptomyces sp. NPDC087440 TaxID=3365790 RepID=UPI003813D5E7
MSTPRPDAPAASAAPEDRSDLGFDWQAERRWSDSVWAMLGIVAVFGIVAVVLAVLFLDVAYAVGIGAGVAFLWGAWAWGGFRLRRTWADEMGVPPEAVPVLARRLAKERIPESARARRAMGVLVRRSTQNARMAKWGYPVAATLFLVSAALQVLDGDWGSGGYWIALAGLQVAAWFTVRRSRRKAQRVLARLEGSC